MLHGVALNTRILEMSITPYILKRPDRCMVRQMQTGFNMVCCHKAMGL